MFLLYIFAADVFAELMTIFWVYMGCFYGLVCYVIWFLSYSSQ